MATILTKDEEYDLEEWLKRNVLSILSSENSDTLNEVIKDMIAREQLGIKKYGTTIDRDDYSLKDWMQHHYEELLDAALYVKKQIQKLENK